ncbi:hypothetical protein BCR43DRAFT_509023 [Syncephalastrum racemosum]|uniref:Uncharacterized protein n=1 Tax=Syncephalastrum racemosum TaxID=13706 RepID=A0A1X2H0E5_SYNRA|nr:hypothetical protein BCR43DRAFT_509023 [Syncephalastrum racemosum]
MVKAMSKTITGMQSTLESQADCLTDLQEKITSLAQDVSYLGDSMSSVSAVQHLLRQYILSQEDRSQQPPEEKNSYDRGFIKHTFFGDDEQAYQQAIHHVYMDLQTTMYDLRNALHLEDFTTPWRNIDKSKQTAAILDLEAKCSSYGVGLNRCVNSWAANRLMACNWGNKFQYANRGKATNREPQSDQIFTYDQQQQ